MNKTWEICHESQQQISIYLRQQNTTPYIAEIYEFQSKIYTFNAEKFGQGEETGLGGSPCRKRVDGAAAILPIVPLVLLLPCRRCYPPVAVCFLLLASPASTAC